MKVHLTCEGTRPLFMHNGTLSSSLNAYARQLKALKQKTAALSKAKSADRAQLDQEARRRLDALELQLQRSLEYESRITRRLVLQERNLLRTRYEQQVLQHRLDAIQEGLQRHGLSPQPGEERQQPA